MSDDDDGPDVPPIDASLLTRRAILTGVPEGVAVFPDRHPEPADAAISAIREGGHRFSISDAAEACGVSRDVIKRRRVAGAFPNAEQDDHGTWSIPLGDLLAAGFSPGRPVEKVDGHQGAVQAAERVAQLETETASLRSLLAERERVLAERDRALRIAEGRYESAEQQLRALMPGMAAAQATPSAPPVETSVPVVAPVAAAAPAQRRRWWQRSQP